MPFRRCITGLVALCLVALLAPVALARPTWKKRVDHAIAGHSFGVVVREGRNIIYNHRGRTKRRPASNEKLLTSMVAYQRLGPNFRSSTSVRARHRTHTIAGNLFLVGRGDPGLASPGRYGRALPFAPTRLKLLAKKVKRSGVRRVRGRVIGALGYYKHDWWARGWHPDFPVDEVALPTALAINGNARKGRHIHHPEKRAASLFTRELRHIGVNVRRSPRAKYPPGHLKTLAASRSKPLHVQLRYMDRQSVNWLAEMFAKRIGLDRSGAPGTISKGARAIRSFASDHGVRVKAFDGSGLSFANRVSPRGLVKLLHWARSAPWGGTFKHGLATGGQGTLEDRLQGVRVRAKTGTLDFVSALSGYVWLKRDRRWAEFSILDSGMYKTTASSIEDRVVRILFNYAHSG